ncbi:hypothetical protein [Streptomyces sp. NPDC001678]|uniref:hypothetical protein n=1 Tax=Streptomyces sp. NPDC001678 TaxID=3364599 RepID=UPI0036A4F49B
MKVHVLFDVDGKIITLVESTADETGPQVRPLAKEGQSVAELEVPTAYSGSSLLDLLTLLRVEVRSGTPRLVGEQPGTG